MAWADRWCMWCAGATRHEDTDDQPGRFVCVRVGQHPAEPPISRGAERFEVNRPRAKHRRQLPPWDHRTPEQVEDDAAVEALGAEMDRRRERAERLDPYQLPADTPISAQPSEVV